MHYFLYPIIYTAASKIAIVCYYNFNKESIIESIGFKLIDRRRLDSIDGVGIVSKTQRLNKGNPNKLSLI